MQTMGIDVWLPRNSAAAAETVAVNVASGQHEASENDLLPQRWQQLQQQVNSCQQCQLSKTRTQTVFGEGDRQADWMLIGEAPGKSEDEAGRPFCGQSGFLLTEMLRAIGLQRESVYIANVVKCRPPDNRDPQIEELNSCHDYLRQQIELVAPKIILAVGRVSAQTLLQTKQSLSQLRGIKHEIKGIPLIVVYHPAYLLRSLLEKRKAWQDLQLAMKIYQEQ